MAYQKCCREFFYFNFQQAKNLPIRKIQFEYTKGGGVKRYYPTFIFCIIHPTFNFFDTFSIHIRVIYANAFFPNLAFEFDVSERTIRYDIEKLTCYYLIYTTQGTGGGVHIVDGYRYGFRYLANEEIKFLESIVASLTLFKSV